MESQHTTKLEQKMDALMLQVNALHHTLSQESKQWLTFKEVAQELHCSERTTRDIVKRKGFPLPVSPTGGNRAHLWPAKAVREWLARQRVSL